MDLGATVCTPSNPTCALCPLMTVCAGRKAGIAETLPRKAPKKAKPTRYGMAWVAVREDGAILLDRRPQTGLLGGMMEVMEKTPEVEGLFEVIRAASVDWDGSDPIRSLG